MKMCGSEFLNCVFVVCRVLRNLRRTGKGFSGSIPLEAENTESLSHTYFWGNAPLEVLVKRWLTSSVKDWESFSSRDHMGCTEHSSTSSTEIDDPLYVRRLSQGVSRGSQRESSHLFCMLWIAGWLWSQFKGNWPHLNLILGTPSNFAFLGDIRVLLVLWQICWDSLEFNQANRGSLCVWLGKRNCSACNAGESGLISWRGGSLMGFLELPEARGLCSRVMAGMSIRNWSLFSEVRTPV